jgi:hypothetical protein
MTTDSESLTAIPGIATAVARPWLSNGRTIGHALDVESLDVHRDFFAALVGASIDRD